MVISGAVLVGLFFVGLAALYWLNPADHLPAFVPGYDPESDKRHFTHGLGMLVIGLMAFALAAARLGRLGASIASEELFLAAQEVG